MSNHARPEFSQSRRCDVNGSRVKLPRTWSEKQELRGDDLAAMARAYQARIRIAEFPRNAGEEPCYREEESDASPRDESLEAWVRRTDRQEDGIYFLLRRVDDALDPFMAKWLTAETLDKLTVMISTLLPHLDGLNKVRLQEELERLTTWAGLGEYLGRLARAQAFEKQLAEERTRRLEATSRRPRTRPGRRR